MRRRHIVLSMLVWVLVPGVLCAQERSERSLKGIVVGMGEQGERLPEGGLQVIIQATGDSTVTSPQGMFRLFLADIFKAGEKVILRVDKPGWCIQYPLEGEVRVPADLLREVVEVRLLPAGSKLFWTPDRIEKFIQDIAEKAKQQVTPEGKPEQLDLSRYVKEWAVKYGFSAQQAKAEIDAWIAEVEKNQNDLYTLGLAAFARKNFGEASKLFTDSAEYKANKLAEIKQREQTLTTEVVRDFRLAGDAHLNDDRPDQALQAYHRALQYVTKEQTPQLWAAIWRDIGKANWDLAGQEQGPAMQQSLREAEQALRRALEVHTREHLPEEWAMTQYMLGGVLFYLGVNVRGEEGARMLQEVAMMRRHVLEVISRLEQPELWASTQASLGLTLYMQARWFGGADGARKSAEATMALQQALEVYTREQYPEQWVYVQFALGRAFFRQSETAKGQKRPACWIAQRKPSNRCQQDSPTKGNPKTGHSSSSNSGAPSRNWHRRPAERIVLVCSRRHWRHFNR